MLVIRLARQGRTKYPVYRIVAAESSRAATGKFVEILGHYNPHTKELNLEKERIQERLNHGAQPSNSVVRLLQKEKVDMPDWVQFKERSRKPKNEPEVKEEAVAEVPSEPETSTAEASEEPRVAEQATENAAEVEDNQTPAGKTETAVDTAEAAKAAEAAEEETADAVIETEQKESENKA